MHQTQLGQPLIKLNIEYIVLFLLVVLPYPCNMLMWSTSTFLASGAGVYHAYQSSQRIDFFEWGLWSQKPYIVFWFEKACRMTDAFSWNEKHLLETVRFILPEVSLMGCRWNCLRRALRQWWRSYPHAPKCNRIDEGSFVDTSTEKAEIWSLNVQLLCFTKLQTLDVSRGQTCEYEFSACDWLWQKSLESTISCLCGALLLLCRIPVIVFWCVCTSDITFYPKRSLAFYTQYIQWVKTSSGHSMKILKPNIVSRRGDAILMQESIYIYFLSSGVCLYIYTTAKQWASETELEISLILKQ